MTARWVTIKKAAELTGLPDTFFDERTGRSGRWPEGVVWKWFEGRKMIDSQALDEFIDGKSSPPSTRGRKKAAPAGASKEEEATSQSLPPFRAAFATYPAMPPVDPNARIPSGRSRHVPSFTVEYLQQYARDYLDLYRARAGAPEVPP